MGTLSFESAGMNMPATSKGQMETQSMGNHDFR